MNPALNYLGAGAGMTMPGAVPGAPNAAQQPAGPASAGGLAGMLPPGSPPSSDQYLAETQQDGSILLRMKNPDGSPGVVVKIINPIKPKGIQS